MGSTIGPVLVSPGPTVTIDDPLLLPDFPTASTDPTVKTFPVIVPVAPYFDWQTGTWKFDRLANGQQITTIGPSSDPDVPRILAEINYKPLTAARLGAPIYLGYGRHTTGGHVVRAMRNGDELLLLVVWEEGEVDAVEKVYAGDLDISGSADLWSYTGTQTQTGDPTIAAVFGQADDLQGICYSVISHHFPRSLNFRAVIRGRKVFDPRTSTTVYSTNCALVLADFIDNYSDYSINWTSVEAAADYCDEEIAPGIKRWEIGMVLADRKPPEEWIKVLAEYANCYVFIDNGVATLLPDEARAVDHVLTGTDVRADSFDLRKAGQRDVPTQVFTDYLLPIIGTGDIFGGTNFLWTDAEAFTQDPLESQPLRITRLKMGGYFHAIHAQRKATQYLNYANIADLSGTFEMFDRGAELIKGDVISVTHPFGLSDKEFRVMDVTALPRGRWRVEVLEYSPLLYSDEVVADPNVPDTDLPDPTNVPDGPAFSDLREVLFTDTNSLTYTRFEIRWLGVTDYPWVRDYRVQVTAGSTTVMDVLASNLGSGVEHLTVTPPTAQGVEYTVKIWIVNIFGTQSANPGIATITGNGKIIPPTDPSGLDGREAAQFVTLSWNPSVDTDLRGYPVRKLLASHYDAAAPGDARWSHANHVVEVNRHDSTKLVLNNQPVGAWYYMVKAEDFAGNFSVNFTAKLINVTEDQSSKVIRQTLANDTLVNMFVYDSRRQQGNNGGRIAVTSDGQSWVTMFGVAGSAWTLNFSAGNDWLENTNVASSFESAEWDTGKDNSGNWIFQGNISAIGGATLTFTTSLAKAADYPTFTDIDGQSVNAEGRYYKAGVAAAAGLGLGFQIEIPIDVTFTGKTVLDNGTSSVPAVGQPLAVTFNKVFGVNPKVSTQLLGSTPGFALPDNVSLTGFDLYVWDVSGTAMAGTVDWTADGI
jgi:hypothetical protein